MYIDPHARLTRATVLRNAIEVLTDGRDPDDEDELEEALIEVLESTLEVTILGEADNVSPSRPCRCDQCQAAIRLAQAILKEYD